MERREKFRDSKFGSYPSQGLLSKHRGISSQNHQAVNCATLGSDSPGRFLPHARPPLLKI
jgi:hypothetical protein